MHGKEEWLIEKLGSRHKCVERTVWPVFPDIFPFLVTMLTVRQSSFECFCEISAKYDCFKVYDTSLVKI